MKFRIRPGRRSSRHIKRLAVVVGSLFILVGIAALVGDPEEARGQYRAARYATALRGLREAFGDPGGGIAMIVTGILIGGGLWWYASRKA